MKKRKLDNKTLDAIGRKLFEGDNLPADELERIIASRHMFAAVTKRIADHAAMPTPRPAGISHFRRNWTVFAGAAVIVIAGLTATVLLNSANELDVAAEIRIPVAVPEAARPEVPPQPFVGKLSAGRASYNKTPGDKPITRPVKKPGPNIEIVAGNLPEREFYSIALPGQITDMTDGGHQIIRVEMSRSSLFALGANIPLENGPEKVTADLLIGTDGSTRAIRLVD